MSEGVLAARARASEERLDALRDRLSESAELLAGRACVYATGSFGREDASRHSDLDLFIIGLTEDGETRRRKLSPLDEALRCPALS